MFGKKKEQSVETNGIVYRRAKTWRVALAGCSSGIGMCFYVLLGLASYVANEGYGIATAVVGNKNLGRRHRSDHCDHHR